MSFSLPANMPSLSLSIPTSRYAMDSVELNEDLLRHWIKSLPANDLIEFTSRYLDALRRFNTNKVSHAERVKLLDMYREPFNKVVFELTIPKLQRLIRDEATRLRLINEMSEVLAELAAGYKIVVVEANEKNNHLKMSPLVQLAIYRACEQLSYVALHAYKFYRTLPARVFIELHQLYLLVDHAGLADEPAFVNKNVQAEFSVRHRYCQIMLVCICNPYGLASGDVIRCYRLMTQLAPVATLSSLTDDAMPMQGHFYINCLSNRAPTPSMLPAMKENQRPPTLILNTKPILNRIDALFDQAATQGEHHPAADNIRLLRQIVPYLNTSYQRKQQRIPVTGNRETFVTVGLGNIHNALTQTTEAASGDPWLNSPWEVLNKNSYGYLIQKRKVRQAHDLKIGDFVGILEQLEPKMAKSLRLASLRWLRTDDFEQTKMGLQFIDGEPKPVYFSINHSEDKHPAFLMPEVSLSGQPASLITACGVFSPGRQLHIKMGKKRFAFTVEASKLLEQNEAYERFTFTDVLA